MSNTSASNPILFAEGMSPEERRIVSEEVEILARLREHLQENEAEWRGAHYDDALLELRDSLTEAHEDEVAQIVTQMSSIASLSAHRQTRKENGASLDPESPYFGHMRVLQEGRERDILIGNKTLVGSKLPFPIIDWRHAPISRVFYCYREGDEYEEEIGGREVEGEILAHRRLMILKGALVRIECGQGVFQWAGTNWARVDDEAPALGGGEGTALRPGGLEALELGTGHATIAQDDKHLKAITGLIDPRQFELITRPDSGVVVIDGGAGSGKTTIALHRTAYLTYRDPEHFAPERMMAVVYNKALAAYVSHLLPALGVSGVRIEVFDDLVSDLRRQHYPSQNAEYTFNTPTTVVRFKQHPAAHGYLADYVNFQLVELRKGLEEVLAETEGRQDALAAWDALDGEPATQRIAQYTKWVQNKGVIKGVPRKDLDWLTAQRLTAHVDQIWPNVTHPHELVLSWYEEAFLSLDRLREVMNRLAPGTFSEAQLTEVRDRAFRYYSEAEDFRNWRLDVKAGEVPAKDAGGESGLGEGTDGVSAVSPPQMDREDDTLMLLLYVMTVGALRSKKKRPLKVAHLMVDEAQDLGPLDLRVLIGLTTDQHSVTLAGDTDQRMILNNSFTKWEEVLTHLDLESTAIEPLQVGYRSTEEIMAFARSVLGPLATERPWVPTRKGVPVQLVRFTDPGQAVASLSDHLLKLIRKEPGASVALISRYPAQADLYYEGFSKADLPLLHRVVDQDFTFKPGIEVTDINQVKGLEFDYVVILDADHVTYPDDDASRYMLHIGATRAAHQLWLVSCRAPSPVLPADLSTHLM